MKIRVANAPVSWGVNEHSAGAKITAGQFLDELRTAGYEGTELGPFGFLPTEPAVLGEELHARRLHLLAAFVPLDLTAEAADVGPIAEVGSLLAVLGAKYIVLSDQLRPNRRTPEPEDWNRIQANVKAALESASALGLRCVFHHHGGCSIETVAEIDRLLELTPVNLCLDTGHYVYGGGDPVEAVHRYGNRVEYLHLKDVNPAVLEEVRAEGLRFPDAVARAVFCPLGQGCVRFGDLFAALETLGYSGWAVVEQDVDSSTPDPAALARQSRRYLRTTFGI